MNGAHSYSRARIGTLPVSRHTMLSLITMIVAAIGSQPPHALSAHPEFADFIQAHCADCHDSATREAGLDLTTLAFDPADRANLAKWVRVHDRVRAGEMPPDDMPRPAAAESESFTAAVGGAIVEFEQASAAREGRSVQRRLNRYEYENALRDLFDAPWLAIRDKLPQDGEAYHHNKVGESLDASHIQIARFMAAADYAARQAMSAAFERPKPTTQRYYARDEFSLRNFWPRENGTLPDRLSFPVLDGQAQPEVRAGRAPASSPETRDREAVGKVSSTFSDAGGYSWGQFRAPAGGRYRLRFSGYTIWVGGGGIARWFFEGSGDEKAPVYHLPLWHRPELDEVWPGRGPEPIGVYASSAGQKRPLGAFDFAPEPGVYELEATLMPDETIQTDGSRLFRTRVNGTDEQYVNPLATEDGMPGYAVQWLEVEGPLADETVGAGYRLLFGELPMRRVAEGEPGVALEVVAQQAAGPPSGFGGGRGRGGPGGPRDGGGIRGERRGLGRGFGGPRPQPVTVEVVTESPAVDGARLLRAFMERSYRRPVREKHFERMLALFHDQLDKGYGFAKSLLAAYTAVLSSPGFVFVEEQPGRLDDHALATRLGLFLWNSPPDAELRGLAARGELQDPAVLRAQAERLLADPRAGRFVEAFTDYWLDLRKLDDTSPSPTLYNDYELDDPLKLAAVAETRLFVAELLREDLPARNVVDSDFTFLNERLARHYGIDGVTGATMRRVALPAGSVRGGLMTQASILKITANGTTTSPVLRGHWITDRILGQETPPPPPVPAIEPDIRGAVTIRQQLEQHRADPSCASCHDKMDPAGFALESFDVMGGWRIQYRAVSDGAEATERGVGMNGQAFAFHYALPVDCTGELPDGRAFADVRELKQLLLADEAAIARNLARQLAVYATGAPVRFADRAEIEQILERTADRKYGVRSLVLNIIQSDLFLNK